MRYSRLTQFNPENVSRLKIAWVFHTGDVSDGKHGKQRSGFETTPILVDGLLIFTTGFNRVIAVNPETGSCSGRTTRRSIRPGTTAMLW